MKKMILFKDEPLSVLHQTFGWGGRDYLSATVLTGFILDGERRLVDEAGVWDAVVSSLGPDQVLDLGMPKSVGEALALGKCYAPPGKEVDNSVAFFRVGPIEKRVIVFGNRYARPGRNKLYLEKPEPFKEMDVSWENAFGGPDSENNPIGKGMAPVRTPNGEVMHPLPNIENPDRLLASLDERPAPAGLGPMGLDWPSRLKNLGAFDDKWFSECWPGLPNDFNFIYYNLAPPDQRLKGPGSRGRQDSDYFNGDEFVQVRGMHPEEHELLSKLPGLRLRLFVNRRSAPESELETVNTNLDTVCLLPHFKLGVVIWHGIAKIDDDEAEDIRSLACFWEPLEEPARPVEFYQEKIRRLIEEEVAAAEVEAPEESETVEEDPIIEPEEADGISPQEVQLPAELAELAAQAALMQEQVFEQLKQFGINLDESDPEPAPAQAPEDPLIDGLSIEELEQKVKESEENFRKNMKELGVDLDDIPDSEPLDALEPAPPLKEIEPEAIESLIGNFEKMGVGEPEFFDELRVAFAEHNELVAGLAALQKAPPQDPAAPVPEEAPDPAAETEEIPLKSSYTRDDVLNGYRQGMDFSGRDLSGLDLSDCDLPNTNLSGAILEKVNFSKSRLNNADFKNAILSGANFSEADLTRADMSGVSGAGAIFAGAACEQALLGGADFAGADFSSSILNGADMSESSFVGAGLAEAKCSGALAVLSDFQDADLSGAVFDSAVMTEADLIDARLDEADFSGIRAKDLQLSGASGQNAVFKDADLRRCRAGENASFLNCNFSGADLSGACWEDSDASGSDFSRAKLDKAHLNRCLFVEAGFFSARAHRADLSKSDFSRAELTGFNLMGGSFRKATLNGANLSRANLYEVDFYKTRVKNAVFDNANLDRTLIDLFGKRQEREK